MKQYCEEKCKCEEEKKCELLMHGADGGLHKDERM